MNSTKGKFTIITTDVSDEEGRGRGAHASRHDVSFAIKISARVFESPPSPVRSCLIASSFMFEIIVPSNPKPAA